MATSKIQTGDTIKVTSGKYKGETGTITGTYVKTRKNGLAIKRVTVSGLPLQTAYQRGFKAAGMAGQMYTKERSLDSSNVSLVDSKGVISKVKITKENGMTVRTFKKGGASVVKTIVVKEDIVEATPALETKKPKKTTKVKK